MRRAAPEVAGADFAPRLEGVPVRIRRWFFRGGASPVLARSRVALRVSNAAAAIAPELSGGFLRGARGNLPPIKMIVGRQKKPGCRQSFSSWAGPGFSP
jgi:hypothetical protein